MKIIKNINLKNLVPGIISLMLIAGMAASTLATNIDLEAFVRRDDFLAKYNELDWRVDDIEKSLDRLYKFTCTNVKTFGGISQAADLIFFGINSTKCELFSDLTLSIGYSNSKISTKSWTKNTHHILASSIC